MAVSGPDRIVDGVYRLGSRYVNWYLVEDGDRLTVVDCALPKFFDQVEPALSSLGRSIGGVASIVLTHRDNDHIGFAERLRTAGGAPGPIHEADLGTGTTRQQKQTEASHIPYLRHRTAWQSNQ